MGGPRATNLDSGSRDQSPSRQKLRMARASCVAGQSSRRGGSTPCAVLSAGTVRGKESVTDKCEVVRRSDRLWRCVMTKAITRETMTQSMTHVQSDFAFNGSAADYTRLAEHVAPQIAAVRGLLWKVWIFEPTRGRAAPIYSSTTRQAAPACPAESPLLPPQLASSRHGHARFV